MVSTGIATDQEEITTMKPNPIKAAREARGLKRPDFAIMIDQSYSKVAGIEGGSFATLPETWRAGLEAAGFDYEQLAADYATWRTDRANHLKAAAHGA